MASGASAYTIRPANQDDRRAVADAVLELLRELTGTTELTVAQLTPVFDELVSGRGAGGVLVAEAGATREIAGVLTYSYQTALRASGRYCLIQELWVSPNHRSRGLGERLLDALRETASGNQCSKIEVGLPGERFPGLEATTRFYRGQGFDTIGVRAMRKLH